ncbi:hypothetical protein V3C99_010222, partial [Haemonchus contortus]
SNNASCNFESLSHWLGECLFRGASAISFTS